MYNNFATFRVLKTLHIVSFDVPFPANYGGVIDVFYKLKQLHKLGIKIILHCFEYGRGKQEELNKYCAEVHYYKRKKTPLDQISRIPFIVKSRMSNELTKRLLQDEHPILFEGLHTCALLDDPRFKERYKIYRESNIEHEYYMHLARSEKNLLKKRYFKTEAQRLKRFEKTLAHANKMLVVSRADTEYLQKEFPENDVEYLPSFHPYENVVSLEGVGDYILYHGNLSISENILAATYLIEKVFSKINHKVIIAGLNPDAGLKHLARFHKNIDLIENPDNTTMQHLIAHAQVNCLHTHQATGLKLKLLNALYAGRHCLVNDLMLYGTDLDIACFVANSPAEYQSALNKLMLRPFSKEDAYKRKALLKSFDVGLNAQRIVDILK